MAVFRGVLGWLTGLVALTGGIGALHGAPPATVEEGALRITEADAVTPDGVRIHYRVAGAGSDVVIAPFALYHGDSLDKLAVGRRVVTYDPRGRGKSQAVT